MGHPHASGPKVATKRWTAQQGTPFQAHWAVDAHGWPVRMMVTEGTRLYTGTFIKGSSAGYLLAGRGYDTDAMLEPALQAPIHPVVPPTSKNSRDVRSILADPAS